jgi:hypothetical protein
MQLIGFIMFIFFLLSLSVYNHFKEFGAPWKIERWGASFDDISNK